MVGGDGFQPTLADGNTDGVCTAQHPLVWKTAVQNSVDNTAQHRRHPVNRESQRRALPCKPIRNILTEQVGFDNDHVETAGKKGPGNAEIRFIPRSVFCKGAERGRLPPRNRPDFLCAFLGFGKPERNRDQQDDRNTENNQHHPQTRAFNQSLHDRGEDCPSQAAAGADKAGEHRRRGDVQTASVP